MRIAILLLPAVLFSGQAAVPNRYQAADGTLRIALAQQPLGPSGPSKGPDTMASGGNQEIFKRYPKASAIGFATMPPPDDGGLSIAALNRMIAGAVRGVRARR
jgi:hypothetical protein